MQRRVGGRSPQRDAEERLQRALQENAQLKSQKNELEEKLKRAQTQFRRIAADWRQVQEGQSTPPPPLHASPSSWQLSSGGRPSSAAPDLPSLPAASPSSRGGGALPSLNPNQRTATSRSPSSAATPLKRTSIAQAHAGSHSLASSGHQPTAGPPSRGVSEAELAACKAALAHAQLQVQQLQTAAASVAATNATSSTAAAATAAASAAAAQQEAASLRTQLQQVREELNKALFTQQQLQAQTNQSVEGLQQHLQGTNTAQQQLEAQYRASLDSLTREKQELTLQLRLMEVEKQALESAAAANAAGGTPDPADLNTVQGELHRKACEVTLLNSRLQYAQGQVETLKGECARLVEELRTAATAHGDTKKALFTLEHEAAALRAKSSTLSDVEVALQRSTAENVRLEEELMKLVGSLQSCNRETEAAVRLEFQARLREVQDMRDTAEREHREGERRLLNAQHDLADVRRTLESVQEDLLLYKGQVAKVEKEKSVLSAQIAFAGHSAAATAGDLTDEDVHRALAVAAMRKRGGVGSGGPLSLLDAVLGQSKGERKDAADTAEAKTALDLFEALNWDGDWELGQLREALATAAMDLELAETRCQQMSEQVDQYRTTMRKLTEERDTLLEEGIELRGRVTHVQTIFAKQQLQAYRAAATAAATAVGSSGNDPSGLISFSLRGLDSVTASAMCRALGIADLHAPVSFFFTLDGLSDYEPMISPTLHALEEVADVRFQYDDLSKDAATLATIQHTTFVFQLHCRSGEGSRLVAMAELSGMTLLTARELSMEESLVLVDGTGASVGTLLVEFCCSRLALPVLLDAPLSNPLAGAVTLSTPEIKSAMVSLRTVRFLRIQLFQAQGLAGSTEDNTLPQPYVFYTATCALDGGLSCVRDTVVQPFNKTFTTDPKFDVAPVDHRVMVDPSLIRFVAFGVVTFVVFDERAKDVNVNLGLVEVALRPLLESPSATITVTQPLHPQGTLSLGISWVCGA